MNKQLSSIFEAFVVALSFTLGLGVAVYVIYKIIPSPELSFIVICGTVFVGIFSMVLTYIKRIQAFQPSGNIKPVASKATVLFLFISCFFTVVMGIMMLYLQPQERLGTVFWIMFAVFSMAAFYLIFYRKESIEKRRVAIVTSLAGMFMMLGVIIDLPKKSPADKALDLFLVSIFGIFCVLTLLGRRSIKGVIIDNRCASSNKIEELPGYIKTHDKSCVLKPENPSKGYSIYAEGKVRKFDDNSNKQIEEFLKRSDSRLEVEVLVKLTDEGLRLITIKNQ